VPGTVLPFSLLYFNAARLDRSLLVSDADHERPAQPRIERIAARAPA
jgi:Ala-tRNA(Pro) deacylase